MSEVLLLRCSSDVEAKVVRALLESYGIPCSLRSDITHVAYPFTVDGLGEVRLFVPGSVAEEAREILEAHRGGSTFNSTDEESEGTEG